MKFTVKDGSLSKIVNSKGVEASKDAEISLLNIRGITTYSRLRKEEDFIKSVRLLQTHFVD